MRVRGLAVIGCRPDSVVFLRRVLCPAVYCNGLVIMMMIKELKFYCLFYFQVVAEFDDVEPDALYDVLHDPEYRSVWDTHMLAAEDAGHINVNNDVGYYASE